MSFNTITCYDDTCNVPAKTMTRLPLSARVSAWAGWIKRAVSVYRQRQHLAQLSPRELSDLGLSRAQAQYESARPFWDLPDDAA
jgi:uncharacterized protein YjiS (DUF1127 family)